MEKQKWRVRHSKSVLSFEAQQKRVNRLFNVARDHAKAAGLAVCRNDESVDFYAAGDNKFADAFSVLVSEADGGLIPDGWEADDGGYDAGFCDESPWKARACELLLQAFDFDRASKENMEYARKVFAGEIVHPSVLSSLR